MCMLMPSSCRMSDVDDYDDDIMRESIAKGGWIACSDETQKLLQGSIISGLL